MERWFSIITDGKLTGCMVYSNHFKRERRRLEGLKGVVVREATKEELNEYMASVKDEINERLGVQGKLF